MPAFAGHDLHFVTVRKDYRKDISQDAGYHTVTDATQWNPLRAAVLALQMLVLVAAPATGRGREHRRSTRAISPCASAN